jgi:prepilin-type N-terminal cleavage/methylation domain-containing protein
MQRQHRRRAGFTLLELAIVVVLIGIVSALGSILMRDAFGDARAKGAVRSIADLLTFARNEAIRTGVNHVVFFHQDAAGNSFTGTNGNTAVVLVIKDDDGDGQIDGGEKVLSIGPDSTGSLSWGTTYAGTDNLPAPYDNPDATFPQSGDYVCCTFLDPDDGPARWVVFQADGIPRAFKTGPFTIGDVGSANGAVYVTSGTRDYAVVLAPLGGVRVHVYKDGGAVWR